jgi:methionyl-tRNA synthetase
MKLDQGIDSVMEIVRAGNRYMEKTAPWTLAKKGETARLETILYTAANAVYHVSVLLSPIMPEKMAELQKVLGASVSDRIDLLDADAQILVGCTMQDSDPLFPRLQEEAAPAPAPAPKAEKKVEKKAPAENVVDLISIDDFFKTQLKTAKILEAEKIEGADKLLKLKIEVGSEIRPLVAGIALYYKPEELIGKTIVIVANLKPAKIRGVESCGMLLAAKNGDTLKLVTTDGEMPSGVSIG